MLDLGREKVEEQQLYHLLSRFVEFPLIFSILIFVESDEKS